MARDGDAGVGVEAEDVEDVLRLRALEQLLEAGGVFEALFEGLGVFGGVGEEYPAVQPSALSFGTENCRRRLELPRWGETSNAVTVGSHWVYSGRSHEAT